MDQERWRKIEKILQATLDRRSDERAAFLEEACAGDDELRREVESLLSHENSAEFFIETSAMKIIARGLAEDDLSGQRIGHYRIIKLIGAGGMGRVYLAEDETLPRQVAIKFLPEAFISDIERIHRFEQEAQSVSALNHPNIITIHEVGQYNNQNFIVTEFIKGRTLRELMKDRRLDAKTTISIATQVASAMKAAHTAFIVHRDIKPENIMVRDDGLVKVLDFGIAKLGQGDEESGRLGGGEVEGQSAADSDVAASLTNPGSAVGTASYMSPEQTLGETLDGRSDLFSLGVVLYEMATGKRLFAEMTRAGLRQTLLGQGELLPPDAFQVSNGRGSDRAFSGDRTRQSHSLATARNTVPRPLKKIIRRCVRRKREERFGTAGELLDELEKFKRQLDTRSIRRIVKLSAVIALLAVLAVLIAAWASVGEEWIETQMNDGHKAAVRRAVFSPDGARLVSVSEDKQVIVWDFARREILKKFDDHTDWIISVAFSPDGKWFATASFDRTVIVWDAARLEKAAILRGHREGVCAVAFSPDGRLLVSAAYPADPPGDDTILWRVGSWEKVGGIPRGAGEPMNLLFSQDGQRLIFHNDYGRGDPHDTWDLMTRQPSPSEFDPTWEGNNAVFSPDGRRLVSVTMRGEVIFVDRPQRSMLNRYPAHQDNGRAAVWSPDGQLVATGAENVILWDAATMRKIAPLEYSSVVWGLAFSPDSHWLVSTHGDGAVLVWDMVERRLAASLNEHSGQVGAVAFAPDGKRVASASEDRTVIVWDAATGRKEMTLAGHDTRVTGVAFAPGGDWLASVDRDSNVIIWDLAQRRPRLGFNLTRGVRAETHCLVVSPDGRWLALSQGVYESATGSQVAGFDDVGPISPANIYGLTFSVDGRWLALADTNGNLLLWDTGTRQVAYQANISPAQLISVSFSPDGEWLVTGEDQGTVRLWSTRPLRQVAELGRHKARVKSVAFSPDGKEVVSAGDDKTICLWDADRCKLITRIGTHMSPVLSVVFSPDGKQIVSGERDHSVRLYTRRRGLWGWRLDH